MRRPPYKIVLGLLCFVILTGCNPTQPFYLRDYGDLSYYLDQQIETKYPDVESVTIEEVANAHVPLTVENQEITDFVDLSLEDAVSIALQNSKVIRGYGTPGLRGNLVAPGVDNLSNGPAGAGTIYDVAIRESEPGSLTQPGQSVTPSLLSTNTGLDSNQGVEAALAEFDAAFTTSAFWSKTDRPQNFVIPGLDARRLQDFNGNFVAELSKKTAVGTQLFVRNSTDYRRNNNPLAPAGAQALSSIYTTAFELEARQPLLRGRGAFINRMPVIFARIGTDQQLAAVETQLQNLLCNVEIRYWNLQCAYRAFEAAKQGRDSALEVYNLEKDKFEIGSSEQGRGGTRQSVAEAQGQYFFFRTEVERRYSFMLDAESDLRWLLGWAATDGRFIRPSDDPITTRLEFDWCRILNEAISLRPQLRQERWELKKRQLGVAYAKNGLLPQLNAVGAYSVVGLGDKLYNGSRNGLNFPAVDSNAWDVLTEGDFQEYRFGFEFGMPVGYRRELANVRNAQLKLAREIARLEDMELDVSRELAQTYRALFTNLQLAESHYNRWTSAVTEVNSFEDLREAGQGTIDLALDALRRRAEAETAYFESICEYNKNIALMHLRKGTIMQYNGVQFGEGPWPGKAYDDAMENARRRGASREINYGWSRPGVVSLGGLDSGAAGSYAVEQPYYDGTEVPVESIQGPYEVIESGPAVNLSQPTPAAPQETMPEIIETMPEIIERPVPAEQPVDPDLRASVPRAKQARPIASATFVQPTTAPKIVKRSLSDRTLNSRSVSRDASSNEPMHATKADAAPVNPALMKSSAVIRQVNHQE